MDFDMQEIDRTSRMKDERRKPNKFSSNTKGITLVSEASKEPSRQGFSITGWNKTKSDLSSNEMKLYNSEFPYYEMTEGDASGNLYFVARWSKNHFIIKNIKGVHLNETGVPGDIEIKEFNSVKDLYENSIKNTMDYIDEENNLVKGTISLRLESNVPQGNIKFICENAIIRDSQNNIIKNLIIRKDNEGDYFKICPENLGKFRVKIVSDEVGVQPYFMDKIVLDGDYTLPYKHIKFFDIDIDDKTRAFNNKYNETGYEKTNFNTNNTNLDFLEIFNNYSKNVSNKFKVDETGREIIGYRNSFFKEDIDLKHVIPVKYDDAPDNKVRVDILGNPDNNSTVSLYPIYKLKDYEIKYNLEGKFVQFKEGISYFPNTFNADNPKTIGFEGGVNKYFKKESLNPAGDIYVETEEKYKDIDTIYVKDNNNKSTVPSGNYDNLSVKLEGSFARPYNIYTDTNLIYNADNTILEAIKLKGGDAVSDTTKLSKSGVFFIKENEDIIIEPPTKDSVDYEEDNKNFTFSEIYESSTGSIITKDEVTGKFVFHVNESIRDKESLNFYAVWKFEELIEAFINNDNNIESTIIE